MSAVRLNAFSDRSPPKADAAEINVDPLANNFTAVSSHGFDEFLTLNGLSVFDVGHYFQPSNPPPDTRQFPHLSDGYNLRRDYASTFRDHPNNTFLVKWSYWLNP